MEQVHPRGDRGDERSCAWRRPRRHGQRANEGLYVCWSIRCPPSGCAAPPRHGEGRFCRKLGCGGGATCVGRSLGRRDALGGAYAARRAGEGEEGGDAGAERHVRAGRRWQPFCECRWLTTLRGVVLMVTCPPDALGLPGAHFGSYNSCIIWVRWNAGCNEDGWRVGVAACL